MRGLTLLGALAALAAAPAAADTLVAARTVRAQAIIVPEDLALMAGDIPGVLADPAQALGLEARTILYAGRPIRSGDVGPAALVERNAMVVLVFRRGGLIITAEGRALGRAGAGDQLRVLNLSSRTTVTGIVESDGRVAVGSLTGS